MRPRLAVQINEIHQELVAMGVLIERALESAMLALTDGNCRKAAKTQKYEHSIDRKERKIESMCMYVLLTQQPVAGDLRLISAALKMITDMEHIGDQAEELSEIAMAIDRERPFDMDGLEEMAAAALNMIRDSISSFVQSDLELAKTVILNDDIVDDCFKSLRNGLIDRIKSDPAATEQSMDLFMAIKYLERIGDHACNIAEWVIYSITGEHNKGSIL
jgi:phosphate transport system protein